MTITFYQNFSETNRLDKNLSQVASLTGSLRGECSITDPAIAVEWEGAPSFVNYMYIPEFGRYYYITNITNIVNDLWVFEGHVDVLGTYKSSIRSLSGIINRQQNMYNLYLDDDKFLVNAPRKYWTKAFPGRVSTGADSFILTVAGGPN